MNLFELMTPAARAEFREQARVIVVDLDAEQYDDAHAHTLALAVFIAEQGLTLSGLSLDEAVKFGFQYLREQQADLPQA